jgi:hypothetical protein
MDVQVPFAGLPAKCEFSSLLTTFVLSFLTSFSCKLLIGLSLVIPFLGTRIAYAIISVFSSTDLYGVILSPNPTLSKLNPITGDWVLFLVLGPVMEYIAVCLYIFASVILARRKRYY